MIIGKFTSKEDGHLEGFLDTITGDVGLKFTPHDKGVDYTVTTD
jgi:uncharacterized protein (DUF736 family)